MNFELMNRRVFRGYEHYFSKFFSRFMVMDFEDGRLAEVELITTGTIGVYNAYRVSIRNKAIGDIAVKTFPFNEYLDRNGRDDNRSDWDGNFHIWHNSHPSGGDDDIQWYIAIPSVKNIVEYAATILSYIDYYKYS